MFPALSETRSLKLKSCSPQKWQVWSVISLAWWVNKEAEEPLHRGASINPAAQGIQPRCLLRCAMKARLQTHTHVRQSSAQFHLNASLYLLTQFYLSSELKFSRIQKGSESHSAGRSGAGVLQTRPARTTNLTGKWSLRGEPSWQAGPSQIAAKRCWTEADE